MRGIKAGFTFLELLVVIMILGLVATIIIPNLQQRLPSYKRKEFIMQVRTLVNLAWQNALIRQKPHRVFFDLEHNKIQVEIEKDTKDKEGKQDFELISIPYMHSVYQWPATIVIKNFYIQGNDMFNRPGIKTETLWFYIAPDGLTQQVIINISDLNDRDQRDQPHQISLSINPFTAQLQEHEGFTKP